MSQPELKTILSTQLPALAEKEGDLITRYFDLVLAENQVQNLTRITNPQDFFNSQILDIWELHHLKWTEYPAMDLGSGSGIPGILMAILDNQPWILAESERKKADFLDRTVKALGLENRLNVFPGRAEVFLKAYSVKSIVVKAVGPIERIYGWIRKCSTWNCVILFKGPNWDNEWQEFLQSKWGSELEIEKVHEYSVGPKNKQRLLILLKRKSGFKTA